MNFICMLCYFLNFLFTVILVVCIFIQKNNISKNRNNNTTALTSKNVVVFTCMLVSSAFYNRIACWCCCVVVHSGNENAQLKKIHKKQTTKQNRNANTIEMNNDISAGKINVFLILCQDINKWTDYFCFFFAIFLFIYFFFLSFVGNYDSAFDIWQQKRIQK